jgi:hypothetical protein
MCSSDLVAIPERLGAMARKLTEADVDTLSDRELNELVQALRPALARLRVQEARLIGEAYRRSSGPP